MPTLWTEDRNKYRWKRVDGAVVRWDDRSPWPNPAEPTARMWTAWEPNPSEKALYMKRGRIRRKENGELWQPGFPRRWKTAQAAMRALDREYPCAEAAPANKGKL